MSTVLRSTDPSAQGRRGCGGGRWTSGPNADIRRASNVVPSTVVGVASAPAGFPASAPSVELALRLRADLDLKIEPRLYRLDRFSIPSSRGRFVPVRLYDVDSSTSSSVASSSSASRDSSSVSPSSAFLRDSSSSISEILRRISSLRPASSISVSKSSDLSPSSPDSRLSRSCSRIILSNSSKSSRSSSSSSDVSPSDEFPSGSPTALLFFLLGLTGGDAFSASSDGVADEGGDVSTEEVTCIFVSSRVCCSAPSTSSSGPSTSSSSWSDPPRCQRIDAP
mmetsp:Transcript_6113/g.14075  ORF Transcript_6113/g.14075 Transcript_6113/m.14075 type:complete len:280 (-) Transcript_6113:651-1490(-)